MKKELKEMLYQMINKYDDFMEQSDWLLKSYEREREEGEKDIYTDDIKNRIETYRYFKKDLIELLHMDNGLYWFRIAYDDGGTRIRAFHHKNQLFNAVVKHEAFTDCSNEMIQAIVCDGKPVHYYGWLPNMEYRYEDEDGNIVWDEFYPELDH